MTYAEIQSDPRDSKMFASAAAVVAVIFAGTAFGAANPECAKTAPALSADEIAARVMRTEEKRNNELKQYSATRRYVLTNKRFNKNAEMMVRALYRKNEGKTFQVLAATGSEDVSRRVFDKLLDMETEASKNPGVDPSRLIPDNYKFTLAGTENRDGRNCYVLQLTPRKHNKYLLDGKIWVDAEDFGIVRLEGRPSASLGFFVGRPYIVQTFRKVNGYWLSAQNHSTSETRLMGKTELTIDYSDYQFNVSNELRVAMQNQPKRARDFFTE